MYKFAQIQSFYKNLKKNCDLDIFIGAVQLDSQNQSFINIQVCNDKKERLYTFTKTSQGIFTEYMENGQLINYDTLENQATAISWVIMGV